MQINLRRRCHSPLFISVIISRCEFVFSRHEQWCAEGNYSCWISSKYMLQVCGAPTPAVCQDGRPPAIREQEYEEDSHLPPAWARTATASPSTQPSTPQTNTSHHGAARHSTHLHMQQLNSDGKPWSVEWSNDWLYSVLFMTAQFTHIALVQY